MSCDFNDLVLLVSLDLAFYEVCFDRLKLYDLHTHTSPCRSSEIERFEIEGLARQGPTRFELEYSWTEMVLILPV